MEHHILVWKAFAVDLRILLLSPNILTRATRTAGTKRRSQVTGQVTGHRAQVSGHRAQGTGHRSQGTGHRLQGTGHRS